MEIEEPQTLILSTTPPQISYGNGQLHHPFHSKHNPITINLHLSFTTTKPHTHLLAGTTTTTI